MNHLVRPASKVTLHDVAAAADVSIATVSRAINGLAVSKESEARVKRAVARLGYVANETARALRNERSLTLGLIFFELSTARGLGLLDALSATVEAGGYSLMIATARGEAKAYELLLRRFLERRVDGLFCVSPEGDAGGADACSDAGIPVLALRTRGDAFRKVPLLEPVYSAAGDACSRELYDLGHRRIVFIDDERPLSPLAAANAGWGRGPFQIERVPLSEIGAIDEWVRDLISRRDRPTVIAATEPQAEAALAVCRSAGIAVPADISIVAISTAGDEARARRLEISSILLDSHKLGEAAGKVMLQWLQGHKPKVRTPVEVGTWVPRATTGQARAGAGTT